jgi:hypothetical protein
MNVDPYKRLDRVSCPDMEIRVLPNLGIAVDRVSCPDTDTGVSGTICITCSILHEFVCIDLKCNGYVLVLIEVELILFVCSKCIRSIWTKTNTNIIMNWKITYSHMVISRNDNYVQWMFTADTFRKRQERRIINSWTGFHVLTRRFKFCLIWELPWTRFHVLTRISEYWLPGSHEHLALRNPCVLFQKHGGACTMYLR